MPTPREAELIREALSGSTDAIGELFSSHWTGAWRAAMGITGSRALADDVAQDAFERAIRALGRFDGRRPFAAWLHTIVVNRCHDVMRRERRITGIGDDIADPSADDPESDPLLRGQVRAALAELSLDRRTVIVLHYWLGHPAADIAAILGVPIGTVHSRMSRGLAELRQSLEVEDAERPR
ncbi:RNA polymerase sigma factor [Miltoncostaea oceani]|uniref:RNA polymerase sigma factor n=1 Tax=Miltoncostaea oceani TaxID=2843216 RepID=UPI001C3D5D72|nr:RNA polymerase sigma factor [Miltoncostaea oceani]